MSSVAPLTESAANLDGSPRVAENTTVVASPTANAETIIGAVTVPSGITITSGVLVICTFGITIGTSGVSYHARVRNGTVTGSVVGDAGVVTAVATDLYTCTVIGYDTAAVAGTVENVTVIIASGAATSTVTPLRIVCVAI